MQDSTLLDVSNLSVAFQTQQGSFQAINQINLKVSAGKTVALVGESGCGKSVTSLAIMHLLPELAKVTSGSIILGQHNLLDYSQAEMRKVRGREIGMIFQEPLTALNPVYTVGQQIQEAILIHEPLSRSEAKAKALQLLDKVRIPDPEKRYDEYPFQLSGGMKQRVLIAIALSCQPKVLIADEPTTALDVTIQAQILELMRDLQQEFNMGMIFITHDLGVVAEMADDVMIMYAGQVVEEGTVFEIFDNPKHPYTKGLLASMPTIHTEREKELSVIPGSVPSLMKRSKACLFNNRCQYRRDLCDLKRPELIFDEGHRYVACHYYKDL